MLHFKDSVVLSKKRAHFYMAAQNKSPKEIKAVDWQEADKTLEANPNKSRRKLLHLTKTQ